MKHLFLFWLVLTGSLIVFLPFLAWGFADHGRYVSSLASALAWVALLAWLLVKGAN